MVFDQSLEERKSNQGIPHVASTKWPSGIFGEKQGIQAPEFGTEQQAKLQGKAATLKAFEVIWPLSPRLAMFYAMVHKGNIGAAHWVTVGRLWGHLHLRELETIRENVIEFV